MQTYVTFLTRKPYLGIRSLPELERVIALVRAKRVDYLREDTGKSYFKQTVPGCYEFHDRDLMVCHGGLPADAISVIYRRVRSGGMKRGGSLVFGDCELATDIRNEAQVLIPEHVKQGTIIEVPIVEWGDAELECECSGENYGKHGMSLSLWGWGIPHNQQSLQQYYFALPSYQRLEGNLLEIWGDCERIMHYST